MFLIKTHAILLNISNFPSDVKKNEAVLVEYAYDYVDVLMQVYRTLNVFSFKEKSKAYMPIIGCSAPEEFKSTLPKFYNVAYHEYLNIITDEVVEVTLNKNLHFKLLSAQMIKALKLISGVYLYESCFYNCETKSSMLTPSEVDSIFGNINSYMVIFFDYYL